MTTTSGPVVLGVILLCIAVGHAQEGQSSVVLAVTGQRPVLLWMDVDGAEVDNLTSAGDGNQPLYLATTSDGSLTIRVKANYPYALTVTGARQTVITAPDPHLEWREHEVETLAGEQVTVTLDRATN